MTWKPGNCFCFSEHMFNSIQFRLICILHSKAKPCFSASQRLIPKYELLVPLFVGHTTCFCKPQPMETEGIYIAGNPSSNKCNVHIRWINTVFNIIVISINDMCINWDWSKSSTLELKSSIRPGRSWLSQILDWSSDKGTWGFQTLQHLFLLKESKKRSS